MVDPGLTLAQPAVCPPRCVQLCLPAPEIAFDQTVFVPCTLLAADVTAELMPMGAPVQACWPSMRMECMRGAQRAAMWRAYYIPYHSKTPDRHPN
jgi:hypothetical protein